MTAVRAGESAHQPEEHYDGPALVLGPPGKPDDAEIERGIEVRVHLRGHFEPIDGRFHWYGRIAPSDDVDRSHRSGASVTLQTPYGSAEGRLSDTDPWGRFRITGLGRPPF